MQKLFIVHFFDNVSSILIMENRLKVLNCHERDGKQNGVYRSVSNVLDYYCPFPEPNQYMREQIALGSELHKNIENFYNGIKCNNTNADFLQFTSFADYAKDVLEIEPYRTEWKVYDDDFKLSGTIDMIFRNKNDHSVFYLYDWKRSKKQSDKDSYRYVAQLNLYKFILERNYGIKIDKMYLVYFHPSNIKYRIAYVAEKKINKYLQLAKDDIVDDLILKRKNPEHKTTRKRKRDDDMDDSNPLKWMTGGSTAFLQRNCTSSLLSRSGKRRRRTIRRTKKRR
jgi:CRISPR/Cas system-associated exonuclease Cas4 (RecB family)